MGLCRRTVLSQPNNGSEPCLTSLAQNRLCGQSPCAPAPSSPSVPMPPQQPPMRFPSPPSDSIPPLPDTQFTKISPPSNAEKVIVVNISQSKPPQQADVHKLDNKSSLSTIPLLNSTNSTANSLSALSEKSRRDGTSVASRENNDTRVTENTQSNVEILEDTNTLMELNKTAYEHSTNTSINTAGANGTLLVNGIDGCHKNC